VKWPRNSYHARHKRMIEGMHATGAALDRKFWPAIALYGVLAILVWFTLGEGKTLVFGRLVEIRWIPEFVLGMFVFRTVMAREADKIRRRGQEDAEEL
jgi:hypothetical protein